MKLTVTTPFQEYLQTLGIDIPDLLERAGISKPLWREEVKLTDLEYYRLLEELDRIMSEEKIRTLSQISKMTMFIPAFFAALSASHGIEALQRFSKFKKIVGPIVVEILEAENTVSIFLKFSYPNMMLPRFSVLNEQLLVLNLLRTGTGKRVLPLFVESPYEYEPETLAVFGCPFKKTQVNRLVFDKKDLIREFLTQNNIMWQYLQPSLNQELANQERNSSFSYYVQKELYVAIPSGEFLIEDIAKRLGVSVRTLQRNLNGEQTSFKKEVQAVQKAMTFSYLNMNLTTKEIASLVGYSEISAFSRAFKSWTGKTLGEYKINQSD